MVRKREKNGKFWNLPDESLGKCQLDGSWFIVGGQRTLVKQGNKMACYAYLCPKLKLIN